MLKGSMVFAAAGVAMLAALSGTVQAQFGPGSHWVDTVTAGSDSIPSALMEFGIDTWLDGNFDGFSDLDAQFVGGPTTVSRSASLDDSANYPGLRPVDAHLDVVDTEIVSMTLTGIGASTGMTLYMGQGAGVSSVPGHPGATPTLGAVAEQLGDPTLVDSFFDVYVEVVGVPVYGRLHNDQFLRFSTALDRFPLPIGTDYVRDASTPVFPVPLLDDTDTLVGYAVNLSNGGPPHFLVTPEPATLAFLGASAGLLLKRRRRPTRS